MCRGRVEEGGEGGEGEGGEGEGGEGKEGKEGEEGEKKNATFVLAPAQRTPHTAQRTCHIPHTTHRTVSPLLPLT